ncbi:ribonuclease III [Citreimonas sp.]|uniref:ribonuclease III n=1 Tax=Citreimonas sp. TaxID=3036715 RepID=UPI0035C78BCE
MKVSNELRALERRLGHNFATPDLLLRAVTHASRSGPGREDNQRLEFLGDRVLGLVMAEALLEADRDATEGQLAPRYNALVRKETCAEVAQDLDIGSALKLGRSEQLSGGRRKIALLGDAMEAVIAAVYLDADYAAARAFILRHWGRRIDRVEADSKDAKTALQEWAQARGMPTPDYVETGRDGPDHAPRFTIEVRLASGETETASAGSKRQAEHAAAKALLARLSDA